MANVNDLNPTLLPAVLLAMLQNVDVLVDPVTQTVVCLTENGQTKIATLSLTDGAEMNGRDLPEFIRAMVVDLGLKVAGTDPTGDIVILVCNDTAEIFETRLAQMRAGNVRH